MSYSTRERKRERNRAHRSIKQNRSEKAGSGYWLTLAKRPSRCQECAGRIAQDDAFVYRHEPTTVLHVRCADRRQIQYRPSWRWERAAAKRRRPRRGRASKTSARTYSPQELLAELVIEAGRTPKGGFTRSLTDRWGVPWPLPKDWRRDLVRRWSS